MPQKHAWILLCVLAVQQAAGMDGDYPMITYRRHQESNQQIQPKPFWRPPTPYRPPPGTNDYALYREYLEEEQQKEGAVGVPSKAANFPRPIPISENYRGSTSNTRSIRASPLSGREMAPQRPTHRRTQSIYDMDDIEPLPGPQTTYATVPKTPAPKTESVSPQEMASSSASTFNSRFEPQSMYPKVAYRPAPQSMYPTITHQPTLRQPSVPMRFPYQRKSIYAPDEDDQETSFNSVHSRSNPTMSIMAKEQVPSQSSVEEVLTPPATASSQDLDSDSSSEKSLSEKTPSEKSLASKSEIEQDTAEAATEDAPIASSLPRLSIKDQGIQTEAVEESVIVPVRKEVKRKSSRASMLSGLSEIEPASPEHPQTISGGWRLIEDRLQQLASPFGKAYDEFISSKKAKGPDALRRRAKYEWQLARVAEAVERSLLVVERDAQRLASTSDGPSKLGKALPSFRRRVNEVLAATNRCAPIPGTPTLALNLLIERIDGFQAALQSPHQDRESLQIQILCLRLEVERWLDKGHFDSSMERQWLRQEDRLRHIHAQMH